MNALSEKLYNIATEEHDVPDTNPPVDWRERIAKLPQVMRWIGGTTLVIAAISFLFNGIQEYDDVARFWHFTTFNLLLSALGLLCIVRFKDDKGARTFMALATGMVPIHFAHFGGIIWNRLNHTAPAEGIASHFHIEAIEGTAFLLQLGSLIVLAPLVAYLGFRALARPVAKPLTLAYLGLNTLLLLSVRDPHTIAFGALATTVGLIWLDRRVFSKPLIMKTWDGICVRAMLYIPIAIAVTRNLVCHGMDQVLLSYLTGTLSMLLLIVAPKLKIAEFSALARFAAFPLAYLTYLWGTAGTPLHFENWTGETIIPLFVMPCVAITIAMSFLMDSQGNEYRKFATAMGMSALAFQMIAVEAPLTTITFLTASALMIGVGFMRENKNLFHMGIIGMVVSSLYLMKYAVLLEHLNIWMKLAALGITIVLAGSYLERNSRQTIEQIQSFRRKVKGWK